MKRYLHIFYLALAVVLLTGCGADTDTDAAEQPGAQPVPAESPAVEAVYQKLTPAEAKAMMEEHEGAVILDVREREEYDELHIPGAALLPVDSIAEDTAAGAIPAKDSLVLIYCRSGRRSEIAANALLELGYTNVYDFGGILDWPYETE